MYAEVNFTPGAGGGPVTDYLVECKRSTQPDADYAELLSATGTTSPITVEHTLNDIPHDCRIQARGAGGDSAWVTSGLSAFVPSVSSPLHRNFNGETSSLIIDTKRIDSLFTDTGCSTAVAADGATINCVNDLSDNARTFVDDATSTPPTWSEVDGGIFTTTAQNYLPFSSQLVVSGTVSIALVVIQESGSSPVWLTDTNNHALKATTGTSQNLHFRSGDVNHTVNSSGFDFQQCAGCATLFLVQRDGSSNLDWYGLSLGSDWSDDSCATAFDSPIGSIATTVTGNFEADEWGNGTTGGNSTDGHQGFLAIRDSLFDTTQKRQDLCNQLLDWVKL